MGNVCDQIGASQDRRLVSSCSGARASFGSEASRGGAIAGHALVDRPGRSLVLEPSFQRPVRNETGRLV